MGAAAVGTTISVYAIARLMMNLPAGILADRYGRKPLLVWGPLITAFGEPNSPLCSHLMCPMHILFIKAASLYPTQKGKYCPGRGTLWPDAVTSHNLKCRYPIRQPGLSDLVLRWPPHYP